MAKIINIVLKYQSAQGVVCSSMRQIAVWGPAAEGDTLDRLSSALIDEGQILGDNAYRKSHSDIVREVCDRLFPNSWAFAAQGGTIEF